MQFITTRELRKSAALWETLAEEEIVVTNNGKPAAFLVGIPSGSFEQILNGIQKVKKEIKPVWQPPELTKDERLSAWKEFAEAVATASDEEVPVEFERVRFNRELDL